MRGGDATDVPVLLLVYRRPETTQKVLDVLRHVRPSRLYVAADGPRTPDDTASCAKAREVATNIQGSTHIQTLFRDAHLGLRRGVPEALDWFFQYESAGIILEDDVVPDPTFFQFVREVLDRYRDDKRVAGVSGNGRGGPSIEDSYTFSRYPHIWGWATWADRWELYDQEMSDWPRLRDEGWLRSLSPHRDFERYWRHIFNDTHGGGIDTWAYQWVYTCFVHRIVTAVSDRALVHNVGTGIGATHTLRLPYRQPDVTAMSFPLQHPPKVSRDQLLDRWEDLHIHQTRRTLWRRFRTSTRAKLRT